MIFLIFFSSSGHCCDFVYVIIIDNWDCKYFSFGHVVSYCICSVLLHVCNNMNDEYTRQINCIQIQALVQDINFIQSSIILKSVISCRVVCKQIFNHVKLEGGKSMN